RYAAACDARTTDGRRAARSVREYGAHDAGVWLSCRWPWLLLLRLFELDVLTHIPHALALVGLRRAPVAQIGRDLAHLAPVHTLDDDLVLARRLDRDTRRNRVLDGMREAERQVQLLALHRGAIADADELELLL